jgi:hypothetical protein
LEKPIAGFVDFESDETYRFNPPLSSADSTLVSSSGNWSMNSRGSVLKLTSDSGETFRYSARGFFRPAGGNVSFNLPTKEGWFLKIQIGF